MVLKNLPMGIKIVVPIKLTIGKIIINMGPVYSWTHGIDDQQRAVPRNPHVGNQIIILVKSIHVYLKVRESLYTLVIGWVYTISHPYW